MIFLLACIPSKPPTPSLPPESPSEITVEEPKTEEQPVEEPKAPLPLMEVTLSQSLPEALKKTWPPQEWSYAKAYTFNFVPYGPGQSLYLYKDKVWNKNTPTSYSINKEQADYALSLVHKTAGNIETSKCTFPRHGIVYFDAQDEPVASINFCFSCEALLVWPPYQSIDEQYKRDEIPGKNVEGREWVEPLVVQIYYELLPAYKHLFFEQLQLPTYSQ